MPDALFLSDLTLLVIAGPKFNTHRSRARTTFPQHREKSMKSKNRAKRRVELRTADTLDNLIHFPRKTDEPQRARPSQGTDHTRTKQCGHMTYARNSPTDHLRDSHSFKLNIQFGPVRWDWSP